MFRNLSIKWRLALQFTLVVFGMLLIAGTAVFVLFINKESQDADTLLYVQAASLRSSLPITLEDISAPDWRDQMYRKIDTVKTLGFLVVITDLNGNVLDHSSTQLNQLPAQSGYSNVQIGSEQYRLYRSRYGPYIIIIGHDLDTVNEAQSALLSILILTLVATLLLTGGLSAMFAGRALQPLTKFSRRMREIDPQHLPSKLDGNYPDDEIGQLARTFDDFLRRLDKAFKRERQFTQDASHELRTPLMVIKSSLELIEANAKTLTAQQREKLTLMQNAALRMQTLVEELLVLSRGMQSGKKEDISLGTFLTGFTADFRAMAEEKGLALTLMLPKKTPTVHAHRVALEKVVGNLLKNAIRFTQKGEIKVEVKDDCLVISDTGPGISGKDLPHIFERFYRADSSRKTEGTGLGLAICKGICDEEGWNMSVASKEGDGSRFTVCF
ncbi:MAG TPA: HAMP domain-containing sensor histidine kinase [Candidatus Peribacteraceae bacterium]|nr:HAMP domain-containing sensor histidine kinase [Candidatus Peribacteraceae bacterium]